MKSIEELNKTHAQSLESLGIQFPAILFPKKGTDLATWSVVACDQYTSDHPYWNDVEAIAAGKPSTLHLTLPEIYLEAPDVESRISKILANMKEYLASETLVPLDEGLIYLERHTESSGLRQGLVFAMDLERYDFAPDSKTLIRATEGTIVDRIPPRLRVRSKADLELPHIMILIDDPAKELIEALGKETPAFDQLYSVDLMKDGGKLSAWLIKDDARLSGILSSLEKLLAQSKKNQNTDTPLFFAMGDGNHSLATAKTHWSQLKEALRAQGKSESEIMSHPARFALAEIVNIHSPGLRFEPIHRAVFTPDMQGFVAFLKKHPLVASCSVEKEDMLQHHLHELDGQKSAGLWDGNQFWKISFVASATNLPPALVDQIFNDYKKNQTTARIDFIHGWQDTVKLSKEGAVGLFVPVIAREKLFSQVQSFGPLPRKAFSMGDAKEKKYYMECRRITN